MDQSPDDPLLGFVMLGVMMASAATWIALITRWLQRKSLLPYEPRWPVPWGAPLALVGAVLFVAVAVLTPSGAEAEELPDGPTAIELAQRLVGFIFFQCAVVGGALFLVAVLYRPTLRDLGLPVFAEELVRDVRIGIVACLAAIGPVYGVQIIMLYLFGPSKHPLVEMVTRGEPSLGVVFLASIAAVVMAPLSEEIFFRLLLQGWLEKLEHRWVRRQEDHLNDEVEMATDEFEIANEEAGTTNDPREATYDSSFVIRHSSFEDPVPPIEPPPARGFAGLPCGWAPILVSSLLFGVAHFGYGPDPIAIFFLALILGHVYQRTHRILPCIVAHALFNSLAMLVLWRMVLLHAE